MGFELVQVRFMKGSRSSTLQVMAEPLDRERIMTVEDCAELSHAISAILDVEDPVRGAYRLEVSSPGLERPLVKPEDYVRFAGQPARVELVEAVDPIEGRKRFKGALRGLENGEVLIETEGTLYRLPLARIGKARLVLPDDVFGGARGRPLRPRRT